MTAPLTSEAFAAMLGTVEIPQCEGIHHCGRHATHYAQAHHHCLIPRGQTQHIYPVCYEVALNILANTGRTAICPVCGQTIQQRSYVSLAGKVDHRP